MPRLNSRINPDFVESQKAKREVQEDTPSSQNSVPQLRERVNQLEEILGIKSYALAT